MEWFFIVIARIKKDWIGVEALVQFFFSVHEGVDFFNNYKK